MDVFERDDRDVVLGQMLAQIAAVHQHAPNCQ